MGEVSCLHLARFSKAKTPLIIFHKKTARTLTHSTHSCARFESFWRIKISAYQMSWFDPTFAAAQQHHFHPTLMGQKFQPVHLRRSYLAVFYPRLVRYPLISAKTYHSLHTLSTVRAPRIEVKREPVCVQHPSFICETCGSL
jgi:hypothetical protein